MKELLYIELYRLVRQPRIWITFGVFAIIILLINFGLYLQGPEMLDILLQSLKSQFLIQGNILNGYLIAFVSLNTLWIHIPILLVIVTADILGSEFETGAIRNLLCSPIKRWQLIVSKFLAAFLYILLFMVFTGILIMVPALLIFGKGDLLVFLEGLQVILASEVLYRYILAIGFGTLGMLTFASISIMLSVFLRNSIAAILASLGLLILSTLIQTFGFGIFESWQVFLFTHHMAQWQLFFLREIPYAEISKSVIVLVVHILIALGLSVIKFNRIQVTE